MSTAANMNENLLYAYYNNYTLTCTHIYNAFLYCGIEEQQQENVCIYKYIHKRMKKWCTSEQSD